MELLEQFTIFLLRKGLEESTTSGILKCMRRVIGNCTPLSVTNFSAYIDNLILSKKAKSYIIKHIYALHYWGEFIGDKAFKSYPVPKLRNKTTFIRNAMSTEEIEIFINLPYAGLQQGKFRDKWYMWTEFWRIQAWTGMRPAEVSRLTIDDVDFGLGLFKIRKTKTGQPRVIPINETILKPLEQYINNLSGMAPDTLLFPRLAHPNTPVGVGAWEENFNRRKKQMNLRREGIVAYSLRHSFPSRIIKTSSIKDVMDLMGHKKITTTEKYLHTDLDSLRETINNDPMGERHKNGEDQLQDILKQLRKMEEKYNKKIYTVITPSEDKKEITVTFKIRS